MTSGNGLVSVRLFFLPPGNSRTAQVPGPMLLREPTTSIVGKRIRGFASTSSPVNTPRYGAASAGGRFGLGVSYEAHPASPTVRSATVANAVRAPTCRLRGYMPALLLQVVGKTNVAACRRYNYAQTAPATYAQRHRGGPTHVEVTVHSCDLRIAALWRDVHSGQHLPVGVAVEFSGNRPLMARPAPGSSVPASSSLADSGVCGILFVSLVWPIRPDGDGGRPGHKLS